MSKERTTSRQKIEVDRTCALGVISFKELAWSDHTVRIVNISRLGVGVESEERVEQGLVWFRDRVGGYKGGVLLWCKKDGDKYRSGIRFVTLNPEEERAIHSLTFSGKREDGKSTETIIAALMNSLTRDEH